MKTILLILSTILLLACNKQSQPQPQSVNQVTQPILTGCGSPKCVSHGACMDRTFEFSNNVGINDTMIPGCKFKYVFINYHYAPVGQPIADSLLYSVQPVNFSLDIFQLKYTKDQYFKHYYGHGIYMVKLITKTNKEVFFKPVL